SAGFPFRRASALQSTGLYCCRRRHARVTPRSQRLYVDQRRTLDPGAPGNARESGYGFEKSMSSLDISYSRDQSEKQTAWQNGMMAVCGVAAFSFILRSEERRVGKEW